MVNKKIFSIGILLSLMMVFILASVHAATFATPLTTETLTGSSAVINVTVVFATVFNCNITGTSSASGDILVASNIAGNESGATVNGTIDSTSIEDAADWVLTGSCVNSTGGLETITSISAVVVDNTVPTAPSAITPLINEGKDNVAIASTVVDATTTACSMTVTSQGGAIETYTMDYSTTTCTDEISFNAHNSYTLALTASDGTDTATASQVIEIKSQGSGGSSSVATTSSTSKKAPLGENTGLIVIIAGVAIFGFTQGWFGKKKK